MRLGIQLIDSTAELNKFSKFSQVKIGQGENYLLTFQLMDMDQGIRYVPAVGSTALVELPRLPEAFASATNTRVFNDFSVRRNAQMLFPTDDRSIWQVPLLPSDTVHMMSTNMRVTLTQGSNVMIAVLPQAIYVFRAETT